MDEREQRRAVAKMLLSFSFWAGASFVSSFFFAIGYGEGGNVFRLMSIVFGASVLIIPMLSCGFGK